MKPFSSIRTRRSTTFAVLLVWLLVLATGVANACLLERPGSHGHGAKAIPSGTVLATPHVGAAAAHDQDSELAKAPCLKLCDDASQSQVKHQTLDPADPSPALLVAVIWTAPLPVLSTPRGTAELQPASSGLPLRVRYSRLAL